MITYLVIGLASFIALEIGMYIYGTWIGTNCYIDEDALEECHNEKTAVASKYPRVLIWILIILFWPITIPANVITMIVTVNKIIIKPEKRES
ncbi:MAG: hypothetical protein J6T99_06245 [Oscillospiraceae bacterium]|nr:hypothetical protein [Oscillospiraceae bacterium]